MRQKRSINFGANYLISLEKILYRVLTVIRFTTTLKISEALHDISNAQ